MTRTLNPTPTPDPADPPPPARDLAPPAARLPLPIRPCQADRMFGQPVVDVPTGDLL